MAGALKRRNQTDLERAETWAATDTATRKQRAARAVRDGDPDALADLLAAYLRTQGSAGMRVSDHTLTTYRRGMKKLLEWCAEKAVKPHQISTGDAKRYRAWLQARYTDKTVNVYLTGTRRFLDALSWAGLGNGENPFEGVTVREATPAKDKADPYTVDELNKLLAVADPRERVMVLLAADGGLRLSEIAGLEWQHVDLERRRLTVTGKGRKRRKPAVTKRLAAALRALGTDAGPVLDVGRERLKQLISALCKRAGVNGRGLHNLRHTCGTRLYEATRDLQAVARHLGHSTTKTSELYAHLADSDYRAAVDALDGNGEK